MWGVILYKILFGFLCKVDLRFIVEIIIKGVFMNIRFVRIFESYIGLG